MSSRDERGNYVNDKGVTIKVSEYKDGSGIKIDFYDKNPSEDGHKSIHAHISNDGSFEVQDNVNGKNEKSSGKCYMTTACMKHVSEQFDDNCDELTTLRWLRDNIVLQEDVDHYYEVAPLIVDALDEEEDRDILYEYIYNNIICECVKAVKAGNYEFAYSRYKNSMLALEEQFVRPKLINRLVRVFKEKQN